MIIPIAPMGAPRQTRSDTWKRRPCIVRYRAFKDELRAGVAKEGGVPPMPAGLILHFGCAMPPSWSKRQKSAMAGQPHRQKPDIDNMTKAVMDCLWPDGDGMISKVTATKVWAATPYVAIVVTE
jgi:Holliday junction resolvase RusA-like endonuclease